MDNPETNYFVCTLGQVVDSSNVKRQHNANDLITRLAQASPALPAVGFFRVDTESPRQIVKPEILTFDQINTGVSLTAKSVSSLIDPAPGETVGLLCSSSPQFFFTWLACIRLGNPILLIAPECTPPGIFSLCQSSGVSKVLADGEHIGLAQEASGPASSNKSHGLTCTTLPWHEDELFANARSNQTVLPPNVILADTDTAYIHHTSGTSSGVPKPIPQSHRGTVGALPVLDGRQHSTFTTTPLYHGGPADTFRAWTSSAMVWYFPSHRLPITSSNVIKCLEAVQSCSTPMALPPTKYFTSVPYILQMMAESNHGMRWLQSMDLVGVGGAALPRAVGDKLVEHGVRLVSRFGSAECGFLLSSHREYEIDKEWQYLRTSVGSVSSLRFEPRDDGLFELVVPASWPQLAKTNREDGSYATSDLFERHPSKPDEWKYHSRADSQLTLITGKKFDPAPIEATLVASSALIRDVLIFGNDQPYPGALLFRSQEAEALADDDILMEISRILENINRDTQSHARITSSMLLLLPSDAEHLPKSSKGTVLRGKAEEKYHDWIKHAYEDSGRRDRTKISNNQIPSELREMIKNLSATNLEPGNSQDLFSFGINSVMSMQLRRRVQQLLPGEAAEVPASIVESCPTVDLLTEYILATRRGDNVQNSVEQDKPIDWMLHLVERYGNFSRVEKESAPASDTSADSKDIVVLTGTTGALGAHILNALRHHPQVSKVYCLVRSNESQSARSRVNNALESRQLSVLSPPEESNIIVLQANLSQADLGLDKESYELLAREATAVMHVAWSVNFRKKLQSFEDSDLAGLRHLIDLALVSPRKQCPRFIYCSSVASSADFSGQIVPESLIDDPGAASSLGYSQSKWVAEHICERASRLRRMKGRMAIARVGQLSGDSDAGIWNAKEAWPLMLSTVSATGSLPDLKGEVLDWLPVDIGAAALVNMLEGECSSEEDVDVFHVLNADRSSTWSDLLTWLQKLIHFEIVSANAWIQRFEKVTEEQPEHPAAGLLDHWRRAYGARSDQTTPTSQRKSFALHKTKQRIPTLREIEPVSEEYARKLWGWIDLRTGGQRKENA